MFPFKVRTEEEMMKELALVAVREIDVFQDGGDVYTVRNDRGFTLTYQVTFLPIRFIESGKKDCVVRFTSTLIPDLEVFYALESETINKDD